MTHALKPCARPKMISVPHSSNSSMRDFIPLSIISYDATDVKASLSGCSRIQFFVEIQDKAKRFISTEIAHSFFEDKCEFLRRNII